MYEVVFYYFEEERDAFKLIKRLKDANVQCNMIISKGIFKVNYGFFESKIEAENEIKKLIEAGFNPHLCYDASLLDAAR